MSFDAKRETEYIIGWIQEYFERNGNESTKAIVGISGGKDSTIVADLCVNALGQERVIGVLMPQGVQHDIEVSRRVVEHLGIKFHEVNIAQSCAALYEAIGWEICHKTPQVLTNTPARVRMTTLYAIAAMYGGRVACTSNLSEEMIGWSTKFGDGAGDFAPIMSYTVTEVLQIGEELGLPHEFIYKIPEDGMTGKSDEENFGFAYKELDGLLGQGKVPSHDVVEKIQGMMRKSKHKQDIASAIPHPRNFSSETFYF